jgi:hypothetical protein
MSFLHSLVNRTQRNIRNNNLVLYSTLLVVVWLMVAANVFIASAQVRNQWTFQRQIPDYYNHSRAPYMVADQNRTVHAFNIQPIDQDETALFYRQWSIERGWTRPIDIIIPPRSGTFSVQEIFLDRLGFLRMIFFVGDPESGGIYFTSAHVSLAGHAKSWSQPILIAEDAGPLGSAAMVHDDNGGIVVLYAGKKNGIGVYDVRSPDNGETWSTPRDVSRVIQDELWPFAVKMIKDQGDGLHVVWSLVSTRGLGEAIYYSRSSFVESLWSPPYLLAELDEGEYSTNFPSIIEFKNEIFVIYQDSSPATRWMRRSIDSGRTWTNPVRPFLHEGEYEAAVLLEDSAQTLHMVLGNRIGNPEIHGMWHSVWTGERWTDLEPIVSGPKTNTFDPSAPQAVISQGNVLLASWWMDTSSIYRNGAWYSYTTLDAPELPVTLIPPLEVSPTQTPTIVETSTPSPSQTATPPPVIINNQNNERVFEYSPGVPILIGIIPAIILITVVIRARNIVQKNNPSN